MKKFGVKMCLRKKMDFPQKFMNQLFMDELMVVVVFLGYPNKVSSILW